MISIFRLINYLISDAFSLFLEVCIIRIHTIYFDLIRIILRKIVWGFSGIVITWFQCSFSYHNFRIPSIKFLANCETPLPFKCKLLLLGWLLCMFPSSIMSICNLQRCDWISAIFFQLSFNQFSWLEEIQLTYVPFGQQCLISFLLLSS